MDPQVKLHYPPENRILTVSPVRDSIMGSKGVVSAVDRQFSGREPCSEVNSIGACPWLGFK